MVERMDVDDKRAGKMGTCEKVVLSIAIILAAISAIVIIILASLYGTRINCDDVDKENKGYRLANTPSMKHFPKIKDTALTALKVAKKSKAAMKSIAYSLVAGKEMTAGLLCVEVGPPLEYTHWYEAILVVLSGTFTIVDVSGRSFSARTGDSMYIPRGSKLTYRVSEKSYMYYVVQPLDISKSIEVQGIIKAKGETKIIRAANFGTARPSIPLFVNTYQSLSYLNDTLFSRVKYKEMTAGLYKLLKGPALEYTYEYEEFKYIVDGEFHLTDGTGKFVKAKAGDLMYFPKGTYVHFTSPNYALGFYVGQRGIGEA